MKFIMRENAMTVWLKTAIYVMLKIHGCVISVSMEQCPTKTIHNAYLMLLVRMELYSMKDNV